MDFRYALDQKLDPNNRACRKALYWLEREFEFSFQLTPEELFCTLKTAEDLELFERRFVHRYNDFLLREELNSKTASLKELILAKMLFPANVKIPENDLRDPLDIYNG